MKSIINKLEDQGVPTNSFIAAGVYCSHIEGSIETFQDKIKELVNCNETFTDYKFTKFTYGYFVQEYVRSYLMHKRDPEVGYVRFDDNKNPILPPDAIIKTALLKAESLLSENPWLKYEEHIEAQPNIDAVTGKVKRKKGWKQERSFEIFKANCDKSKQEIMKMFQDELDMTKSGSQTYYYNAKNKFKEN